MADAGELVHFLASAPDVERHLVIPACRRSEDLSHTIERFEIFSPDHLLFTFLDEADTLGSVFTAVALSGRPASFCSSGPLIPEDLAPADSADVVRSLIGELQQEVSSVA